MAATATVLPTGNLYINGVLSGVKWAVTSLTYSFPTDPAYYGPSYGSGENLSGFSAFSATQQAAVRTILKNFSSVTNLTFAEITETSTQHADLRYAESSAPSTAWAYYPSTSAIGGDAWFNGPTKYDYPVVGNYAYLTMMHETGHAMGLKHSHQASGSFPALPLDRDSLEYSVMSYRSYTGSPATAYTVEAYGYPQTLMMYDVAALQEMYGANYSTNSGNTVYKWNPLTGQQFINGVAQAMPGANKILMNIWDGGGRDTYDFSNYTNGVKVDLNPGAWTVTSTAQLSNLGSGHLAAGNISNSLLYHGNTASLIEDAIGSGGNDSLIGNVANNRLTGAAGNDWLDGGSGSDTAVYSAAAANYQLLQNADGSWTVIDLRTVGSDDTDTLRNIEFVKFFDTIVDLGAPVVTPNNPPVVVSGAQSASVTEWANLSADEVANTLHKAAGTIAFTDGDTANIHTASLAAKGLNYLGTFSLSTGGLDSSHTIGWSFSISDKAIDYLAAGQTLTQYYTVTVNDGQGGTAVDTVTVTIIGASDEATKVFPGKGKAIGKSNGAEKNAGFEHHDDSADNGAVVGDQIPDQHASLVHAQTGEPYEHLDLMSNAALSALHDISLRETTATEVAMSDFLGSWHHTNSFLL